MSSFEAVYNSLLSMRVPQVFNEQALHNITLKTLRANGFEPEHEVLLSLGSRIDILVSNIGIEIKKGKPQKKALLNQLNRYAASDKIKGFIVLAEKSLNLPETISGKPLKMLSLQKLWGIANPQGSVKEFSEDIPQAIKSEEDLSETLTHKEDVVLKSSTTKLNFSDEPLPSYLATPIDTGESFGTLSYNRQRKCWTIKAEPYVTELAKRLFPGSNKNRRGIAYFADNPRAVGDCNWLMQRYPLDIAERDKARWQETLNKARQRQLELRFLHKRPDNIQAKDGSFEGKLMPFQQQGATWIYHTKRGLLADEMGLGKTVQALYFAAAIKLFPILIVVPSHLVLNWESEIKRFLRVDGKTPDIHIIKGLKPYKLPKADIYIVHYLLLRGWKDVLPSYSFPLVIFDEIQELRHAGTEKYSAASLVALNADRVLGLSGTPIYNNGGEIWNVINIIDFNFLGDWESFTREWCYGYGNNIVAKPELLGEFLRREGLMLRRTKAEVLPELPEKRRFVQQIDTDSSTYKTLMAPVIEKLKKWYMDTDLSPQEKALLEGNISQGQRQATGIAKAPYVAQFVRVLVEGGEKVLLFAHHHAVMDIYKKELKSLSPVFITGRENESAKQKSIERFVSGSSNLACISLRAAAGLNLQRASCVVFGELDWSPAIHSQAEDRAHRIGQNDSLLCYYLVSPQGSDADIQDALGLKVSQFLALMGESPQDITSQTNSANHARKHVERMLARFLENNSLTST
ncbi:MAG: DEAD/DEAH box helicase [Eubacteriales bacterium]|nr:DEAD/DEAH box helicase [Eubacteriales bacterium]